MNLSLFIAARYLFARKSHNVINIISAISAAGMAIGTAALILILSVYNGFDKIIKANMSDLDPDVLVTAAEGKHFVPEGEAWEALMDDRRVASITSVIEDNVFLRYHDKQAIARAKGVDGTFEEVSGLGAHLIDGTFTLMKGEVPQGAFGSALAYEIGVRTNFVSPIEIYYPDRDSKISPTNPAAALHSAKVWPGSIFSISADTDKSLVIVPISVMRSLTGLESEVTGVELRLADGSDRSVRHFIKSLGLGDAFTVRDRYQQHPSLYKMMRYEKLAIYMILIFVVLIIASNIFGSLSMLIIEKEDDMATLKAMGADDRLTRRIFVLEGWLISVLGLVIGLAIGIGLALLQQHFGLIKMPGSYIISSYPVDLHFSDVLWTVLGVASIGLLISFLSARKRQQK